MQSKTIFRNLNRFIIAIWPIFGRDGLQPSPLIKTKFILLCIMRQKSQLDFSSTPTLRETLTEGLYCGYGF